MITPATCNLRATKYYDFSHLFTFDMNIDNYTYKSEVRDIANTKVAEFQIIQSATSISIVLDDLVVNTLTTGLYYYDVKQISATGFKSQIIVGELTINDGITQ